MLGKPELGGRHLRETRRILSPKRVSGARVNSASWLQVFSGQFGPSYE